MNKYNSRTIYRGNIIKNIKGINIIIKENELLIYDEITDMFYPYLETFNLFLSRDLEKLTNRKKEKIEKQINKFAFPYSDIPMEEQIYVDENSLNNTFDKEDNKYKAK